MTQKKNQVPMKENIRKKTKSGKRRRNGKTHRGILQNLGKVQLLMETFAIELIV